MQKRNIVLVAFYDLDSFAINTLHSVLKRAGFNVYSVFFKSLNINSTMDPATKDEMNILINFIKEIDPLFVGLSFRSTFFRLVSEITMHIKQELNNLVVWGGTHPTIRPDQCIGLADVICLGEGEGAIVDLAKRLSNQERIHDIPNLWIREGLEVFKNDLRLLIQDLDLLPFPDFLIEDKYLVERNKISTLALSQQRVNYPIMTSRGCPFGCTYCYNNIAKAIYRGKGKYVRRRSVNSVIKELSQAKENFKNLSYVSFLDDLFTFDIEWIRNFSDNYKKYINLPFYCHIHPKFVQEEMIRMLKEAGCAGMTMGIQTGSEESRYKYFERHETNEEIINSVNILYNHRIDCTYDLIMDNPLETDRNKRETLELLLSLRRPFKLCVHSLTHFPETKLTKLLLEKKIISENDIEDKKEKSYKRWVPALDLERDKQDLFWDNLYYLSQKRYFPRNLILWLSNNNFVKKHPKPLTFFLRLTSFSIYTIRNGSRLDTLRWALLTILNKPYLLFKKRTWVFIWSKTKTKLYHQKYTNNAA